MARIPFLRTHSRYREMADAYLDGELRAGVLAKFEAHAAGCSECSALLDTGKALKASLGAVPVISAPRSFRITPALLQERAAAPAPVRATPVLMVARFGAAASVAAFAVVGTLQFSSSSDDGLTAANAPTYELSAGGAEDARDMDQGDDDAGKDDGSGEIVPMATEDPQIAPPPSAGVGGAGVPDATPAPETLAPDATAGDEPVPAADGSRNSTERDPNAYDIGDTELTALAAPQDDANDYAPWLFLLGGLSVVSLAAVGTMELQRRRA